MHVPTTRWTDGSWNAKLPQFQRLAEMLGVTKDPITPEDLQDLFKHVATAKLFAENVQSFIEATGKSKKSAADHLEKIEQRLGLIEPIPFMSLEGLANPFEFDGVAIWPAGTTNWTKLRLEQIWTAYEAGAEFKHIVCLGSSRICNGPADRKHPFLRSRQDGDFPTEIELQQQLLHEYGYPGDMFRFAELPDADRPLSLEQQLTHVKASGQYDELIGDEDIYVPSTPNSLYVPLYVRRLLDRDNVWFSQSGARLVRGAPDSWWPSLQDVMTLPNGMIRLWVELLEAGCITSSTS